MKYIVFLLLAWLIIGCSIKENSKFVINAKSNIQGEQEWLLIRANANGGWDTLQRVDVQNGSFSFEGKVDTAQLYYLCLNGRTNKGKIPLMLEDTIFSVEVYERDLSDFRNYSVKGGQLQQIRNQLYDIQRKDFSSLDSIMDLIAVAEEKGDIATKMHLRFFLMQMGASYDIHENAFIEANKDNIIGMSLVFSKMKMLSKENLEKKFGLLSDNMKNSLEGKLMQERLFVLQKLQPGSIAPDFQVNTLDGKSLSLKDLKGKVKIIDFWASWCGPCRIANRHMKEVYDKYKDKGLTMLSISMDTSKKAWEDAVKSDGLTWLQGCNLDGLSGEIAKKYRITGIPRVFVLDADNRILGDTMSQEEIVKLLEEVLSK